MIAICAGTRPNFIKAAPVIRELKKAGVNYELVKIGQHNDYSMSDSFLKELDLLPCQSVDMKGYTHADQTGTAMMTFDRYVQERDLRGVVVFGDCNASLAPALVAVKRHIPLAHIEAGVRGYNRGLPEEINRILIDSISDILFAPSRDSFHIAMQTGGRAYWVGDVMYDLVTETELYDSLDDVWDGLEKRRGEYYFCTLHRTYNVDDPERLKVIFEAIGTLATVIMPVHPRLERRMKEFDIQIPANVVPLEPVTYRESLTLQAGARKVITDSGGVQKEAFYLGVPCSVLRSETEWIEINNLVAGTTAESIREGILAESFIPTDNPYYHGGASRQITEILGAL